jgi:hypothetical protein
VSSSTANKVTIRETGPASNDRYSMWSRSWWPRLQAFGLVWQTPGADANRSRDRAAGAARTATAPRGCSSRGNAATADHPHPPRCPQAPTLLDELAATTDPNLSWIQRRPSAPEVSCPPASASWPSTGRISWPPSVFSGCESVAANGKLQSEQLLTFNGLFRLPS